MSARGLTDPAGDPDKDGWDNLATFAFARDLVASTPSTTITTEGGSRYLDFTYTRRCEAQGVVYHHEATTSLASASWSEVDVTVLGTAANGDGTETVMVRLGLPIDTPATGNRYFIRARAEIP
jgi:hypothetical protein